MIKFFRKIRQRLLSENKFSKYLVYAVGEIILVVIGILIAIQLNSIKNQRESRNEERHIRTDETPIAIGAQRTAFAWSKISEF